MKMRKTIAFLAAFVASVWTMPAAAVGTIPGISLSQQFDSTGLPLGGGLLYLIQAGTTSTPQNCFQDTGLTIPYPNPVVLDAYGRAPQLFCADGQIKVRLTDKNGVQKFVQDNLLIIGASSGGGGGGTVDPTTVLTTGDFKMQYGTGPISGFVRCNGRTIGSATSGASERANADTSALYSFLWNNDANLVVTGGRGANAASDFAANKPMALPDCRGRILASLDDMGNSAAGRLTATYFGTAATTLGAAGGSQSHTQTIAEMPSHFHTAGISDPGHTHSGALPVQGTAASDSTKAQWGNNNTGAGSAVVNISTSSTGVRVNSANGLDTTNSQGSGSPFTIVPPTILLTTYIKL